MRRPTLVDAVDSLLNKGVSLVGESTIALADVDLIYLRLNLLLASAETARKSGAFPPPPPGWWGIEERGAASHAEPVEAPASRSAPALSSREFLPARGAVAIADAEGEEARPSSGTAPSPLEAGPLIARDPASPPSSQSLAGVVLALADFLRQVIERQALRRVAGGSLSDEQVEELGLALARLEKAITEMREVLGLEQADLEIDLGPLGRLD
ncbi:MAG: gas vesicle protein K [Chloroflexi bacterium]|nr:gas vesicle protein K [Chloroflexota bacterium]